MLLPSERARPKVAPREPPSVLTCCLLTTTCSSVRRWRHATDRLERPHFFRSELLPPASFDLCIANHDNTSVIRILCYQFPSPTIM